MRLRGGILMQIGYACRPRALTRRYRYHQVENRLSIHHPIC